MFKEISHFFTLLGIYIMLGRKGAIPLGIALFDSWVPVFIYVLFIEIIQIPLFFYLLGPLAQRLAWVQRFKKNFSGQRDKLADSKLFKFAKKHGIWGVLFIVSMPAGTGGVLGGILLIKLLGIERRKGSAAILLGILICNCGLVFGTQIFKQLIFFLS